MARRNSEFKRGCPLSPIAPSSSPTSRAVARYCFPGYEDTPLDQRYVARLHAITHDNLTATAKMNVLGDAFCRLFGEELEGKFPVRSTLAPQSPRVRKR